MNKYLLTALIIFIGLTSFAQWNPTSGPGGGTINDFYETGGMLFAATGSGVGGLYNTTDGGLTWEIKNKGLPLSTKVTSVSGDDTYLYTGLHLYGIFRSNDLGETWTAANTGISQSGLSIQCIYTEGGITYIGSYIDGVYISTDHGENWILKNNGLDGAARRVASITKLNDILYVATPVGVYRSENDGDSWHPSSNGIPVDKVYSFDIINKNGFLFVVAVDGIYRSDDSGLSWNKVGGELFGQGVYTISLYEDNLYSGTNGKMYKSADNGDNWSLIGSGITEYAYIYAIHAGENDLICGVSTRGIFKHNTNDDIWYLSNAGLINENVSDMMVDGDDMFCVTQRADFGHIYKTENNGTDWDLSNNGTWEGGFHTLMNDDNYYFAGTDGNFIYRSSDKGENWEHINYPNFTATYVSSFCEKSNVVFASSFGSVIDVYRSTDEGSNWSPCSLPGNGNVMAVLSTDQYVFAGRSDGVFRSSDLGLTWTKTSDGMSDHPFIKKLDYNDDYLFAAASDGLYRSDNSGDDWEKVYNPPFTERIESLATHEGYLYAGTMETGLIYSQDNGVTWETSNPDFFQDPSGIYPTIFAIEIKGDSLYAAYQDFSIWVRPLPNITSVEDNDSMENVNDQLLVYPNPVVGISTIEYSLSSSANVSLKVYNILGQEKKVLINELQVEGDHKIFINSNEFVGGIYFLSLKVGSKFSSQRIVVAN